MRRVLLPALLIIAATTVADAGTAVDRARALIVRYDEDPTRIDRARELLERELARERRPETLTALAQVCFLSGEVRAQTDEAKLAAYACGRDAGERAVELAPRSEDAHVWYAINTGRWAQTKGVMRSLFLVPTVRQELDVIFDLNPRSVRGHALAGNVFFELPALVGGDRKKAEDHYRKGLAADPRFTVLRVDLARLLIAQGRFTEARQELGRVLDESAPTSIADWTVRDRPRARALLDTIKDKP
jgi:predicted Zn-dependent protease